MGLSSFFHGLSNTKTRTMILFSGTLVLLGIGIAATQLGGQTPQAASGQAKTLPVPSNIKAVPGNPTPEQYQALLKEDNQQRAEEAKKNKTSAIATVIGAQNKSLFDENGQPVAQNDAQIQQATTAPILEKTEAVPAKADLDAVLNTIEAPPKLSAVELRKQKDIEMQNELLKKQQERNDQLKQQQRAEEERSRLAKQRAEENKNFEQAVSKQEKAMENQAKAIFERWSTVTPQSYVAGGLAPTLDEVKKEMHFESALAANQNSPSESGDMPSNAQIIKAGTVLFGILETAVNSDEPGPVMASIVGETFQGAKLLGGIKTTNDAEKVVISFNLLSLPGRPASVPVSVVAIDPDTARTALASDVDHHYLLRYGTLLASSFMEGYGKTIANAGSVTTNNPGANTTTTATPSLSGKKEVYAAFGTVGEKWGKVSGNTFNTPNTVTVDSGVGVGLLVLEDIKMDNEGK